MKQSFPLLLTLLFLVMCPVAAMADILFLNDGSEIRGKVETIDSKEVRFDDSESGKRRFPADKVLKIQFLSKKKLAGEDRIDQIRHPELRAWVQSPPKAEDYPGAGLLLLLRERSLTLHEDGSSTLDERVIQLLLKERGLDAANVSFPYLPPHEKGEILFARSISEGKIHYLDDTSIKEASTNSMTPVYDRQKSIKFAIPNAVVGSILDYAYRIRCKPHDVLHPFLRTMSFRSLVPILRSRFTVRVPLGTKLSFVERNFGPPLFAKAPHFVHTTEGKEELYRLEVKDVAPLKPEVAMAPWWRDRPWVSVARKIAWKDVEQAAIEALRAGKTLPKELRNLVKTLKKKHRGRALADALFAELLQKVKFVSVANGQFEPLPRTAQAIWKGGKANYLDKAYLLWTLFEEAGLRSDMAWVANKNSNPILEEQPSIDGFLGGAVWLRGKGKQEGRWYVPWTDTLAPGELPSALQGTRAFTPLGKSLFQDIPFLAPMEEASRSEKTLLLGTDGAFDVEETLRPTGANQRSFRGYKDLQTMARDKALENLVGAIDSKASLESYAFENLNDVTRPLSLHLKYRIRDGAIRGGKQLMVFRVPGTFFNENQYASKSDRVNLMWFDSRSGLELDATVKLPEGFRLRFVPEPLEIDTPRLVCTARYEQAPQSLRLHLRYERKLTELDPKDYATFRATLIRIREYLDQFIVVER